jgi:hypothetical protein
MEHTTPPLQGTFHEDLSSSTNREAWRSRQVNQMAHWLQFLFLLSLKLLAWEVHTRTHNLSKES